MIRYFILHPVVTNLFFLIVLVAGGFAWRNLPVESFPQISFGTVLITTVWPDATAQDIEDQITTKIEEKAAEVNSIYRLTAFSEPGLSRVEVKFDEDLNEQRYWELFMDVQARIREIRELPVNAEPPVATLLDIQDWKPAIQLIVSGQADERLIEDAADQLKRGILNVAGVSRIKINGDRREEIRLKIDEEKMQEYHVSAELLLNRLETQNKNLSAGLLSTENLSAIIRTRGEARNVLELLQIPVIQTADGRQILLKDIATAEPAMRRASTLRQLNGEPSRILMVQKIQGTNALQLVPAIRAKAKEIARGFPEGVRLSFAEDSTTEIARNLNVLIDNLKQGVILVFVLMWFVLGAGNSFLAIIGIPVGFLSGLLFMREWGYSINGVSIFSMVIVSGMVVDDAIVILENITAHRERGKSSIRAAIDGTSEVLWPVLASAATTIAAFLPMVIMTGEIGRVMVVIPVTVTIILIASLLEAFLILPCHAADVQEISERLKIRKRKPLASPLFQWLEQKTAETLDRILKRPILHFILFTATLLMLAITPVMTGYFRVVLFPSDSRSFLVDLEFPAFYSSDQTASAMAPLEKELSRHLAHVALNINSVIGMQIDESYEQVRGEHLSETTIHLPNELPDGESMESILAGTRDFLQSRLPSTVQTMHVRLVPDGPRLGRPIAVRLQHPDMDTLVSLSEEVMNLIQAEEGTTVPSINLIEGKPEIDIIWNQQKLLQVGLREDLAALALAMKTEGVRVSTVHWHGETVDIRMMSTAKAPQNIEAWLKMPIATPSGDSMPLEELAEVRIRRGFATLPRWQQEKAVLIGAGLSTETRRTAVEINQLLLPRIQALIAKTPGASFTLGGEFEESQKSLDSLRDAFVIAAITMFMILAAQFRSLAQPFLILTVIPYSFLGVVFGMGILDQPFTMLGMIAMVGLAGIVVNGNIVLLDFINSAMDRGMELKEAVLLSARRRVRAVVLTTMTTIVGLAPTALGLGGSSIVWRPMAITICFGIFTSMLIILFLMPCIFLIHGTWAHKHVSRAEQFEQEQNSEEPS